LIVTTFKARTNNSNAMTMEQMTKKKREWLLRKNRYTLSEVETWNLVLMDKQVAQINRRL
jgi:hypothetical protein